MFDLATCLAEGHRAGGGEPKSFDITGEPAMRPSIPPSPAAPHPKAFVDFQNDVTTKDLRIATDEGFRAIEHVKRYTTTGMATDQGKTANLNALATIAALTGRTIPEIGLTTFRPPYTPVTFGAFAGAARGDLLDPIRRTPIDDQDAVFEDVGDWKRAHYFPRAGETMRQAVARECRAVRDDLGMFDASTLGKIEVVGPDAAEFLNRVYTGDFTRLEPGRCKYGILLGEDGFIRDDGVIARLAPGRFHVTTTTGGAAFVLHHMEDYRQTEFPSLKVWLTSTTEQWAVIALQGPRAAEALAPFLQDIDPTTMPHMSVREGRFAGVSTRLFRVSFTGELGFEINVPANYGRATWDLLRETGATRYGTETMHVLRAEKGYIVVGQETDGTVIPRDLGMQRTIARGKRDFVGKRSLARPDMLRDDRKRLVGLLTDDPAIVLEEGAQVTNGGTISLGHVTSACHSTTLNRSIALALVAIADINSLENVTYKKLEIPLPTGIVEVTVTEPVFYDPAGTRMTQPIAPIQSQTGTRMLTETTSPTTRKFNVRTDHPLAPVLRAVATDTYTALWLGPDEYLVFSNEDPPIDANAIVDVSHRTTELHVDGPHAAWCLAAFCALDLDGFPEGACTRTIFGKAEILLWRSGETSFHIETARSLAPYVEACLNEAGREFLPPAAAC